MTPGQHYLASGGEWREGMRWTATLPQDGEPPLVIEGRVLTAAEADGVAYPPHEDAVPDLDDPATLGCVLAVVRERWGGSLAHVHIDILDYGVDIEIRRYGETHRWQAPSFALALVAAMEAAPR